MNITEVLTGPNRMVRRVGWIPGIYLFSDDRGKLYVRDVNDTTKPYVPTLGDIMTSDWVVQTKPTMSFIEAENAMTTGKYVRRLGWSRQEPIWHGVLADHPDTFVFVRRVPSGGGLIVEYRLSAADISASDWIVCDFEGE